MFVSLLASQALADNPGSPDYATSITLAANNADNPTDWLAPATKIISINGADTHGLQYSSGTNLIVRTATKSSNIGGSYVRNDATIYGTVARADWVTTGNDITNFYDTKGSGITGLDVTKLIERGLGMDNTGTHNAIVEYTVDVSDNNSLMRPTKNPDISQYLPASYGTNPAFAKPSGALTMTDTRYGYFKDYYTSWVRDAITNKTFPFTQLGYTFFWGNGSSQVSDIEGMTEFIILGGTSVGIYGIYSTQSYIYTKNGAANQYGNGYANFNITGACDSVWAGHRFQAKTKSQAVEGTTNTLENSGTISGGQGVLVWSLNYDVTNSGTISGATSDKLATTGTSNVAVLFKGDTTVYSAAAPTGVNSLTNTGTISSPGTAVRIDAGTTTITNTGTISGTNYAIYSSAGRDTVNINGGTVNGKIDLGGGATDVLNVAAAATLGFTLDRSSASSAQVLNVADVTITDGATIAPTVGGTSNIQDNETFLIVDASNSVTADASNINIQNDSTHPMITFSVQPATATQLSVVASRDNNYYGNNCGNNSLGAVLDSLANNDSGDMATVIGALDGSGNAADAQKLQPTTDNSATQTSQASMDQFLSSIFAHLDGFKNVMSSSSESSEPDVIVIKDPDIWTSGFGTYLHQDEAGSSNGYNATIWGTILGLEVSLMKNLRAGISGGFAQDFIRTKDSSARTDVNNYQGSIYATYAKNAYFVDTAVSFAYNTYDTSRHVAVGTIDRTATGDYNGQQYSGYIGGGYKFTAKNIELTPLASFQYSHLRLNSYTESGAGAANLKVNPQDYNLAQTGLGAKLGYPLDLKNKLGKLTPEIKFKWLYDWVGDAQQATSTFSGGGGSFDTKGFTPAQSSYDFGVKLTLETLNYVTLSLSYDLELKEGFYGHYGVANLRYRF